MKTFHWELALGVQAGYRARRQFVPPISQIGQVYQGIAEELYRETGIYISASIRSARTLYRTEWGCPEGGEDTVLLSGCCNPAFASPESYEPVLRRLAERLKAHFRQQTVLLEILPCRAVYLTGEEGETE